MNEVDCHPERTREGSSIVTVDRAGGARVFASTPALTVSLFSCLCLFVFICGSISCSSAVESGYNTALDSVDLVKMTDDMAMQIAGDPDVSAACEREGPLTIVVQPVENLMTAEVLGRGPVDAFTGRVRSLLAKRAPEKFTWVMNRDAFYDLRKKELDFDIGPEPAATNPRYALTAIFRSLADEDQKRRKSSYLCTYELTNLQTREVLWTSRYEVSKVAVKGFLD